MKTDHNHAPPPIGDLQTPETQPGLLTRRDLRTYAAIGATVFTVAQAAELVFNAEPTAGTQTTAQRVHIGISSNNPAYRPQIGLSANRPAPEHLNPTVGPDTGPIRFSAPAVIEKHP